MGKSQESGHHRHLHRQSKCYCFTSFVLNITHSIRTAHTSSIPPPLIPPSTSSAHTLRGPIGPPLAWSSDKEVAANPSKREIDELRIRLRILENRKAEDQERIKMLEAKVGEADILRSARVKLQGVSCLTIVFV